MVLAVLDRRAGLRLGPTTSTCPPSAGSGWASRPTTWRWPWRWPAPCGTCRCRPAWSAIGEVGLAGEVRRVSGVSRRLAEAGRLGFSHAMVPAGTDDTAPDGMTVHEVPDLTTALLEAGMYATRGEGDGPTRMGPRAVG